MTSSRITGVRASIFLGTLLLIIILCSGLASATVDSNNSKATAFTVYNADVISESVATVNDQDDFYKIFVNAGETLIVNLSMAIGSDLDLYLYTFESDVPLASSTKSNVVQADFNESVSKAIADAGWYYLDVRALITGTYDITFRTMANWTVLVYLDGDNDLEDMAILDFMEMSAVGSTPEMNIVVQFDRSTGYPSDYGDWTDAMRFRVTQGMTPTEANAVEDLGEVNMGDPNVLTDFVKWGIGNYPAENYMLVLWDHGLGWYGISWDDYSEGDRLTLHELSQVMTDVRVTYPGFNFGALGFDACQMAGLELFAELYQYTDYFISSQLNEPVAGWNYELSLGWLKANDGASPYGLSIRIAGDYVASYSNPDPVYGLAEVCLSVINSSYVAALITGLDDLANKLITDVGQYHNYIEHCRRNSDLLTSSSISYVDLKAFSSLLWQFIEDRDIRSSAYDLFNTTILAIDHNSVNDLDGGEQGDILYGMSIYFPANTQTYYSEYYSTGIDLASTHWGEFITVQRAANSAGNTVPTMTSHSPLTDQTIAAGDSQAFSIGVTDPDPDAIQYYWYIDDVLQTQVTTSEMLVSTGPSDIGVYDISVTAWDGISTIEHSWQLTVADLPDLYLIEYFKLDCYGQPIDDVISGQNASALVHFGNSGGMDTGPFQVTCYIDSVEFCYWDVTNVAAGETIELETLQFTLSSVMMHTITFVLDSDDDVSESDEGNNQINWAMYVVPAKWTVLIYMDGDNNLEFDMLDDFMDMAGVGSDENVSVVVQMDRIGGFDDRYGNWTGTYRFLVKLGDTPVTSGAYQNLGEVNMGNGAVFAAFVEWGVTTFQADRYIVIIKDHGGSWYGACWDDTSNDHLYMAEVRSGLAEVLEHDGMPLDIVVFDGCNMGSIEVALELDGLANYTVVSETVGWTNNIPFNDLIAFLKQHANATGAYISSGFVGLEVINDDHGYITQCIAAYDLKRNGELRSAFQAYVVELSRCFNATPDKVQFARSFSDWMVCVGYDNDTIDLFQFVELSMASCDDAALTTKGQALLDLIGPLGGSSSSYIITQRSTDAADFCHGISIYFPYKESLHYHGYPTSCWVAQSSSWNFFLPYYMANAPPMTEASLDGQLGQDAWYRTEVTITLDAEDISGDGIEWIKYSLDGGAWTTYTEPFLIGTEGTHLLMFHAKGLNGAEEVNNTVMVKIDLGIPTASAEKSGYHAWINGSDALSGIYAVQYRLDGGSWLSYDGTFTLPSGFLCTVEFYAEDMAGNVGSIGTIEVGENDTIAPITMISISGTTGSAGWYVTVPSIDLTASDGGDSGLKAIYYRFDSGSWTQYSGTITMTDMIGSFLFQYYAADNFGNNEVVRNVTIKIDMVKPTLEIITDGFAADGWGNASATVNANGTDTASGIASIFYKVNDGAWAQFSEALGFALDGTYIVSFYPVDAAGNVGDIVSITLKVDATAPTSSILIEGAKNIAGTYLGIVNVTISGTDAGSGLNEVQYRIDGGAWAQYTAKILLALANGTYVIEFRAIDACGNIGMVGSSSIVVMHAIAPGKITDLVVVAQEGGLLLSWTAPENGGVEITGYNIYRSVGGGEMQLIGTTNGTSYFDTTAEAGVDYQYQVVAGNKIGPGLASDDYFGVITKVSTDYTFLIIIAVVVVAGIGAVAFLMLRKRK